MSKKKNSRALFEVIANSKRQGDVNMSVPSWMEGEDSENTSDPASKPTSGAKDEYSADSSQHEPQKPRPHAAPTLAERSVKPFEMRIGAGGLTVAILVIVALLVAAFWMGKNFATGDGGQPSPDRATNNDGGVENGASVNAASSTDAENAGSANATGRTPGKYYLIIQVMNGKTPQDRADATEIAEYCTDCGHPARVAEARDRYFVWSLEPFEAVNAEARHYAKEIHLLGKRYRTDFDKDYDFNVLDAEGGVNERRFLQYRPNR